MRSSKETDGEMTLKSTDKHIHDANENLEAVGDKVHFMRS